MLKNFGQITRKYIGKSFKEYSCLQLIYNVCRDAGVILDTFTTKYKRHDMNNYMPYWKAKPEQATKDMIHVLEKTGKKVDPKFPKIGDIMVINNKNLTFPTIYVGNNNLLASSQEQGVIVMPISSIFKLVMSRRVF